MGSVYKARDTRLDRFVAIKTSHQQFNDRFHREAKAIAALNHPNICQLYDVGPAYLVMELIEGPTLADRLTEGALPEAEALGLAKQIAEALEAAHEKGIIHRDLKPGNVKITPDGVVKVLDFGLASIAEPPSLDPVHSPTVRTATIPGTVMGTPAYMSPEQARGAPVDKRTDIWAFGAVLYEMLTGKAPFEGSTFSDILASVIAREPDLEAIAAPLRPTLRRALEKDPRQRWRDIGDLRMALAAPQPTAATVISRRWLAPAAAALVLGFTVGWLVRGPRTPAPDTRILQFPIAPPPGAEIFLSQNGGAAISPDGKTIAFVAISNQHQRLWVRPLESGESRELPGTDGAKLPFWSPDSASIGYFAGNKLHRIDVSGGSQRELASAANPRGGTWSSEGTILYCPDFSHLARIPATGGEAVPVTRLGEGELTHRWPQFLPDGRRFFYHLTTAKPDNRGVFLSSLDHPETKEALVRGYNASLVPARDRQPAYLLWTRDDTLVAQPFDEKAGRLTGQPFRVPGTGIVGGMSYLYQGVSVSNDGFVLFGGGLARSQLAWVDREGKVLSLLGEGTYGGVRLSPDGQRAAILIYDSRSNTDLWVMDLERGVQTRFTTSGVAILPVWSADGRILAHSQTAGAGSLQRRASGTSEEEVLLPSNRSAYLCDSSPDGRYWLYDQLDPQTHFDMWLYPTSGERKPVAYVRAPGSQMNGAFSHDGRWVAYTSDESGTNEIFVQSFPTAPTAKWQVSNGGGNFVRWRKDGKELFYVSLDGALMSVAVKPSSDGLAFSPPQRRFPVHGLVGPRVYPYDVSADGRRFLILRPPAQPHATPLTLLMNWQAGIKHRLD